MTTTTTTTDPHPSTTPRPGPHSGPRPRVRPVGTRVWTGPQIAALGAVTDLPTAAAILGLSRTLAYDLAKRGQFPVPVIRAGARYRVPVAPLLAALHLPPDTAGQPGPPQPPPAPPGHGLDDPAAPSIDHQRESDARHHPAPRHPPGPGTQEGQP